MATLDPRSPTFAADADNLADALLVHGGPDTHWVESGRLLCSGCAMRLRTAFSGVNLTSLYKLISGPLLTEFVKDALANSKDDFIVERLARFAGADPDNKEIRSIVVSCAITQLGFIGNKPIADSLSASTFSFRDMKKRPMTVYLILPGRYLASCSKWFRVIVASAVDSFLHEGERDIPVLAILDEFASAVRQLGVIETAMALRQVTVCKSFRCWQDLSQLQGLYPQTWETFLGNSGFRIFFAPRDKTTSEYVSSMGGDTEIRTISKSLSDGKTGPSVNIGYGQQSRRYLLPHEARELPGDEMILFGEGIAGVIRGGRRPYYASPEFKGMYDPDPYHMAAKSAPNATTLALWLLVSALECGGQGRNRTADASLFRAALYQLSYLAG